MRSLLLCALLAFVCGPAFAQSGTIVVPLQTTNNTTQIVLPPPDAGRTHVRFNIDHTYLQSFQVETDEQIADGAYYDFYGQFTNGWSLKTGSLAICGRRAQWSYSRTDECDPFDGSFDGGGSSGWTVLRDVNTNAGALVSLSAIGAGLALHSDARTTVGINIQTPIPGYANVTYLARSQARAFLHFQYE